jgi:hypothetical protein
VIAAGQLRHRELADRRLVALGQPRRDIAQTVVGRGRPGPVEHHQRGQRQDDHEHSTDHDLDQSEAGVCA